MKKITLAAAMGLAVVLLAACGKKDVKKSALDLVTLGQYKGIEVSRMTLEVSDDDVLTKIYTNFSGKAEAVEAHDTVEMWDVLDMDYTGYFDDVAFEGGAATGAELQIGSNAFIPGFESSLIGAQKGSTVDIFVTFPEDYGKTDYAGKEAKFTVTINDIKVVPELTDEFIAENTSVTTYAEYVANVRDSLEQTAESTIENQFKADVIDKILEGCTFDDTLKTDVDAYAADIRTMYESYAAQYNITLEQFLAYFYGVSLEMFEAQLPEIAEYNVKCERIFNAIAEAEGLTVTDEEYNDAIAELMQNTGASTAAELEEAYGKEAIMQSILAEKAEEIVFNSAVAK